jgi:membrane fusion protein (multidrug efflux system)
MTAHRAPLRSAVLSSLILLPLLALSACKGDADAQAAAPPPMEVTVVTLKPENVTLTRELSGRVTPSLIAEVRPQVTGIVQRRLFTEGGTVRAGQPLYQIDDTAFRAANASAQAQLARAQASLTTARLNAARSAELVRIDAVSKQDDDNAQAALRQAQADVNAARAAVQGAGVPLGFTRVTAPISGQIGRSSVTAGALVTASQPAPMATIQQLDPVYIDLSQSSAELLQLRREVQSGQMRATDDVPVDILLEDGTLFDHQGRLSFAEATVDPTTGSFNLRVVVPNPGQVLLPGMYVRANVASGARANALLVPQPAITRDPKGGATAMVVNAEGKVEPRQVKVSRTVGNRWLVEDGLKAGDRVIVEGLQKIQPGATVKPVEQGSAPTRPAPPAAPAK